MAHTLLAFFQSFPPILGTILMAVFPIVERFALPVAIAGFHLPIWEAFILVVGGNMVPVVVILTAAEWFHEWLIKNDGVFGKAWARSIAHVQAKFEKYEKYGLIGLLLFLAIPTPFNGAFSASLVAFILGYPMRKSLPYLFAGVILGNTITLLLTLGAVKIF